MVERSVVLGRAMTCAVFTAMLLLLGTTSVLVLLVIQMNQQFASNMTELQHLGRDTHSGESSSQIRETPQIVHSVSFERLLQEPFAGEPMVGPSAGVEVDTIGGVPVNTVKGLALKIRVHEEDAPNRVLAAKFLGTVDCIVYPEAMEMLVKTMQEDPSEEVRYEAVQAIRSLFSHGIDRDDELRKGSYDTYRGCCDNKVLNALCERASEVDKLGLPLEPSERVRRAAQEALVVCKHNCGKTAAQSGTETGSDRPAAPKAKADPMLPDQAPKRLPVPPSENPQASPHAPPLPKKA